MRAIGPNELIKLRSDRQSIQLYLAIHKPTTVFTARVNQATFTDPVSEITYDGGVGTYGNILPEMIMLVGSSAGARDKGIVRIRKAASATKIYIGLTSEIVWENDDYLTVLDCMPASVKVTALSGETLYMDGDIEYSDQHTDFSPIPIIGNHVAGFLEDGTFSLIVDASDSYVLGDTIASYLWTAPGASATANLDTATPTITYNAAGTYRVGCTVTADNGKTTTSYRYVLLYDEDNMPIQELEITRLVGSVEEGGWEFAAKIYEDISDVLPNAMCILFAKDYYDLEQISLGYVEGSEQVIAIGWIDEESSEFDYQLGIGSLYVYGLHHVLSRISGYPITLYAADDEPSTWKELGTPTVDEALFHLMYWRSNIIQITDVILSGDTRRMPEIELPVDNLWNQIVEVSERRMLARACCNRYNTLYVEIPSSLLEPDDKAFITTVMDIEKQDWGAKVNIEYTKSKVALLELAGIRDDTPEQVIMTKAPGLVPKSYGSFESYGNLVFDNQAHANTLSGLMLALLNNEYPFVDIFLAQNNRFIDICPNQYVTIDLVATDTPRRVVWTNKKLRVNRVIFEHDPTKGSLQTGLECATETANTSSEYSDGITVIPPTPESVDVNIPDIDIGLPGFPIFPPGTTWWPPVVPPSPPPMTGCLVGDYITGPFPLVSDYNFLTSEDENERLKTMMYAHANLRPAGVTHESILVITGQLMYRRVDGAWVHSQNPTSFTLRALDAEQNTVLLGVNDLNSDYAWNLVERSTLASWLKPISATEIHGFEIEIPNPSGTSYTGYWDFTGSESPMGWAPVPTNPSFPNGNVVSPGPLASADARGGVFSIAGGIGARGSLPGEPNPGVRVDNVWAFYPESVYAQVGSFLRGYNGEIAGFTGLGIKLADQSWHFVSWYTGGSQLRTVTIGANGANKKVTAFAFHSSHGGSDWTRLLNAEVGNFTTDILEYRLSIEKIELFNVCQVS